MDAALGGGQAGAGAAPAEGDDLGGDADRGFLGGAGAQVQADRGGQAVQFGVGLSDAMPGSARTTYLVVSDIEAAHRELTKRGLAVSPIRHKTSTDDWQGDFSPGVDPDRRNYASFIDFADPDGNTWIVQERGFTRA